MRDQISRIDRGQIIEILQVVKAIWLELFRRSTSSLSFLLDCERFIVFSVNRPSATFHLFLELALEAFHFLLVKIYSTAVHHLDTVAFLGSNRVRLVKLLHPLRDALHVIDVELILLILIEGNWTIAKAPV